MDNSEEIIDSIVGYGTFITNKMFKLSNDVKVCFVSGFRRIYISSAHFPFALRDPSNSGFYALLFRVKHGEFSRLDDYEGVSAGLFSRDQITILVKGEKNDYSKQKAFIYLPTERTIAEYNLSVDLDKEDKWLKKIRAISEVCEKYPELFENTSRSFK